MKIRIKINEIIYKKSPGEKKSMKPKMVLYNRIDKPIPTSTPIFQVKTTQIKQVVVKMAGHFFDTMDIKSVIK